MDKIFYTLYVINIINFFLMLLEYFYSKHYKKDNVHKFKGTMGNTLNGLSIKYFIAPVTTIVFFKISPYISTNLYISNSNFELLLNFVYCLVLLDFFYYFYHRVHHYFDFFWMFHSVHHSDDHFNLSTSFRLSIIERLYLFMLFVPVILLGFNPYIVFLSFGFHSAYVFFGHCQYIKLPKLFDYIFITPQLHKIHHDQNHLNNNYGAVFSFWDRLFGTYVDKIDSFTPGIKGYHQDNFILMQTEPIVNYFKKWKK